MRRAIDESEMRSKLASSRVKAQSQKATRRCSPVPLKGLLPELRLTSSSCSGSRDCEQEANNDKSELMIQNVKRKKRKRERIDLEKERGREKEKEVQRERGRDYEREERQKKRRERDRDRDRQRFRERERERQRRTAILIYRL